MQNAEVDRLFTPINPGISHDSRKLRVGETHRHNGRRNGGLHPPYLARRRQVTALNAVMARMPMTAKTTRKMKNRTLAISAAPVARLLKPNRPAIAASTKKINAH